MLTLACFVFVRRWEDRETVRRCADLTHVQLERLQVSILRSMEVLQSVSALVRAKGNVASSEFRDFVRPALERQSELQALSWNPLVLAQERKLFEQDAIQELGGAFLLKEIAVDGTLRAASQRSLYVPVRFIEPLGPNSAALGLDLGSDPTRLGSLESARDSGLPVATAPIKLAQAHGNEAGLLVVLPVYQGVQVIPSTVDERRARLRGFAVAVFRIPDLVGGVFQDLLTRGIQAEIHDSGPLGERIYATGSVRSGDKAWVDVGGRRWAVTFSPTPGFRGEASHWQSWVTLLGGIAFTVLASGFVGMSWRKSMEIERANTALQREIGVRELAEREAERANQAKSDFLASMSHEIRTPLNAILGYAQLLRRETSLSVDQRESIGGIYTNGHHLLRLVNEVLDLAKIEAGRMELRESDFDLGLLAAGIERTFRPLCAQQGIEFRLSVAGDSARWVCGDEGKLNQVLINLVGNAVKFTQAGEVALRMSSVTEGQWLFEVVDTGPGIPVEEQSEIFKPFHQGRGAAHQGGTGLGLSIAKRQVELLGGELELQSERSFGSRFYFKIPLKTALAPQASPGVDRATLLPGTVVSALIVDDQHENREVLAGLLEAMGCEVAKAADLKEALECVEQRAPTIVFLDWLLPGSSGSEVAAALEASPYARHAKKIMYTASMSAKHREEAAVAGCVGFLHKPFTSLQLRECLARNLGVSFEEGPVEVDWESQPGAPAEPAEVSVPEPLLARLIVAAELHSTTALKQALTELRTLGSAQQALSDALRHRMRSFDMLGIQRALARCAPEMSGVGDTSNVSENSSSARANA